MAYYNGHKIINVVNFDERKEEETKTQALAMASGNQVITPTTDKVMTQVTITKPSTLIPANIKDGINIGGVLGTMSSGLDVNNLEVVLSANGTTVTSGTYVFFGHAEVSLYGAGGTVIVNNMNIGNSNMAIVDLTNKKVTKYNLDYANNTYLFPSETTGVYSFSYQCYTNNGGYGYGLKIG